jgi:osmotically inducible lipoprotein OsmB
MNYRKHMAGMLIAGLMAITAAAPAMADRETRNTVIGAGVGGVAGAVLSNGDPWATVGGAAAGGLIGNLATSNNNHHDRGRHYDRHDRRYSHHRAPPRRYHHDHR